MSSPAGLDQFISEPTAAVAPTAVAQNGPPSGLDQFIAPELREEHFGGLGQQAIAGLEGAARGVSLGGSDLLETKLLGVPKEDIAARMEANPVTSTAGSIAGGAGLILGTGGLGALAEGVTGGAGLAASALGAGAEGALFGAGSAVTDYALGDPGLNAQKVLSDIGLGAALGVGAGALGHGIKSVIGKFGGVKGSVSEALLNETESANRSARTAEVIAKQNGLDQGAPELIQAATEENLPVMSGMVTDSPWVKKAEDALINGAPTYSGIKRASMYADAYNGAIEKLDTVLPSGRDMSSAEFGSAMKDGLTGKIEQESKPIGELYNAIKEQSQEIPLSERSAPAIARNILNLDEVRISPSSPEAKLANRVADEISNLKTVDDVKSYRAVLNRSISPTASSGEKRMLAILSDKLGSLEEASIERHAMKIKSEAESFAESLAGDDPEKQALFQSTLEKKQQLAEQMGNLLEQKKIANEQYKPFIEKVSTLAEQLGKRRVYGPQDAINFIQDLTPEQVTQKLFTKKNSQFLSFFEKNFPDEMAMMREYQKGALKEAASKSGEFNPKIFFKKLNELEPEVQKSVFFPEELRRLRNIETYLGKFPKNFNPSGTSGMNAFREFFKSPTGALIANTRDFGIEAYIKTMGSLPEHLRPSPEAVGAEMASRFNHLNTVKNLIDRTDSAILQNTRALIGAGKAAAAVGIASLSAHTFDQKAKRIKELASNPDTLSAHIENHIHGIADGLPNVSAGISTSLAKSVDFLNSKLPKPNSTLPLSRQWEPSEAQKQKFDRYYAAVSDPIGTMKLIKSGDLTSEHLEALQVVHPELLNEMRAKINQHISSDVARKLPYKTKQSMALFLGTPLDEGMLPQVIASNQMAFNNQNQARANQQNSMGGKSTLGGMKELKLSKRLKGEDSLEGI